MTNYSTRPEFQDFRKAQFFFFFFFTDILTSAVVVVSLIALSGLKASLLIVFADLRVILICTVLLK